MMTCHSCSKPLSDDETGLSRKLINRNTDKFYCLDCLAKQFKTDKKNLEELIKRFRESGCTLFN